jgi:hypothetical protein
VYLCKSILNEKDMRTNFFLWMALIMVCVSCSQGEYKEVASVPDGLTIVERNGKYGLVDENGKMLLKIKYDSIISSIIPEGYGGEYYGGNAEITNMTNRLVVAKGGKCGLYNTMIRDFELGFDYDTISDVRFGNGIVCDMCYYYLNDYYNQDALIINGCKNGKWHNYYINVKKNEKFEYECVGAGVEGETGPAPTSGALILFKKDGKYGFLDLDKLYAEEDLARLAVYEETKGLEAGVAGVMSVKQNGKWGAVDGNGELMIPCKYEDVVVGYEWGIRQLAEVKQNGKWGLVNLEGEEVLSCEYDEITGWYNIPLLRQHGGAAEDFDCLYNIWTLKKGDKYGFYYDDENSDGTKYKSECEYDSIGIIDYGFNKCDPTIFLGWSYFIGKKGGLWYHCWTCDWGGDNKNDEVRQLRTCMKKYLVLNNLSNQVNKDESINEEDFVWKFKLNNIDSKYIVPEKQDLFYSNYIKSMR